MIASQWKELQRQIKRQHSWILRALDTIKAEILATDVSVEGEEGTGSPKVSGLKFALFPLISVFFFNNFQYCVLLFFQLHLCEIFFACLLYQSLSFILTSILFLFMFCVALHSLWDLSSSTRATAWKYQVLTTGLPRDSLLWEVPLTSILKRSFSCHSQNRL